MAIIYFGEDELGARPVYVIWARFPRKVVC